MHKLILTGLLALGLGGCSVAAGMLDIEDMEKYQAISETVNLQICLDVNQTVTYGPYASSKQGYVSFGKGNDLQSCVEQLKDK